MKKLSLEFSRNIIAFDPLADFGIGDLNQDNDMRDALRAITRLCKKGNPNRAIEILHHALTGKSGRRATGHDRASFGRNSKVLQAWTRGQINVAAVNPDNDAELVIACGKCSNGKEFAPFAVKLNPETMIYEVDPGFNLENWQSSISGKPDGPLMTPTRVRELCSTGGMMKSELAKAIIEDCGCYRTGAYRYIKAATKSNTINHSKSSDQYFRK